MRNKLYIVTGANGQIASYLAEHIAQDSQVQLNLFYHIRKDRLVQFDNMQHVRLVPCDLQDYTAVKQVVSELKIDDEVELHLIHAASVRSFDAAALMDSDPDIWFSIFDANLKGTYNLLREVLPLMHKNRFGRIVIFGSNVTKIGLAKGTAYAAAKAAMVNIVKSLALEHAADNILINAISPAPVDTKLQEDFSGEYLQFRQKYFEEYKRKSATHSLVSKQELLLLCNILLSSELTNLTGQEIFIEGAQT